jgi:hypothetical protein
MAEWENEPGESPRLAAGAVPENTGATPGTADATPEQADAVPEEAGALHAAADADDLPERAASLAADVTEARSPAERRRLMVPLEAAARAAGRGVRATGRGVRATGRGGVRAARRGASGGTSWLTAQVVAMGPRLRVRDQAALREQFPGMSADEIATALTEGASRASAAVGGAVGAWAVLPVLPAFPAEIATETLSLVGIELKLVAELHEAYGMPAKGNAAERASAYLAAWANRRGIFVVPGGLMLTVGSPLARRLRWRLAARAGRSVFSLGPLFTGAAAGALLNRRETLKLGREVSADLRSRASSPDAALPAPKPPLPPGTASQPEP